MNHAEKTVIFGAWDKNSTPERQQIFGESWTHNAKGRKYSAFPQSRRHIRLVEEANYKLMTFPMIVSNERKDKAGNGPSKIGRFERVLSRKVLRKIDGDWFAYDEAPEIPLPEEITWPEQFTEGSTKTVSVNAYERSREARDKCIAHYKAICAVCDVNFEERYGEVAKGFIHVHHLVPLSEIKAEYKVDPIKDLRPVCPNCHAVIHYGGKLRSIEEVKELMHRATERALGNMTDSMRDQKEIVE